MKQLDSLRAIAVILVIISHWIAADRWINTTPNGVIGVDIFFVLSGFLISWILFENRKKAERIHTSKSTLLKNFYVRRTLRIFPIYYATIFLLLIFSKASASNIHGAFLYFVTYTSNIYFFKIKVWDGVLSHLWSLAVEEQFYLIWPWIILFTNKKYLRSVIVIFIFIGIAGQYLMQEVRMGDILTFTCFDAFGLGALLAWQLSFKPKELKKFYHVLSFFSAIALVLFVAGIVQESWSYVPLKTLISILSLWVITYIVLHYETNTIRLKIIWNNRVLIFLGKISYGMYLYHNILPRMLNLKLINKYVNPLLPDVLYKEHWWYLFIGENAVLLIIVSWLSYTLFEKRFLGLKKYFGYQNENSLQQIPAHVMGT
ncbi:MAG TPA: acyltransferase [Chitinophagaceae bacterium]|nr:acyltransferase [Chitinophagaceae bacterium]